MYTKFHRNRLLFNIRCLHIFLNSFLIGAKILAMVFLKKYTTVKHPAIKLCTIKPPKPGSMYPNIMLILKQIICIFQAFFEQIANVLPRSPEEPRVNLQILSTSK